MHAVRQSPSQAPSCVVRGGEGASNPPPTALSPTSRVRRCRCRRCPYHLAPLVVVGHLAAVDRGAGGGVGHVAANDLEPDSAGREGGGSPPHAWTHVRPHAPTHHRPHPHPASPGIHHLFTSPSDPYCTPRSDQIQNPSPDPGFRRLPCSLRPIACSSAGTIPSILLGPYLDPGPHHSLASALHHLPGTPQVDPSHTPTLEGCAVDPPPPPPPPPPACSSSPRSR